MAKVRYIGEGDSTEAFEITFVKGADWDESDLKPEVFAILSKNPQFKCTGEVVGVAAPPPPALRATSSVQGEEEFDF